MVPNLATAPNQVPNNPLLNPNLFYNPFLSGFVQQTVPVAAATTTVQPTGDFMTSQQVAMQAWMQQAYVQYVNQYMNM